MGFIDIDKVPSFEPVPGFRLQTPHGERLMLSRVCMAQGVEVPWHEHPHEQGGIVLEGKISLSIGEETRILTPGSLYIIPGNVRHRAFAVDGPAVVLDVFSPILEDYVERSKAGSVLKEN